MDARVVSPSPSSSSADSKSNNSIFSAVSSFVSNWLYATFGPIDSFMMMSGIVLFGLVEFAWWLLVFARMMNGYLQTIVDDTSRQWLLAIGATVPVVTSNATELTQSAAEAANVDEQAWRESVDVWMAICGIASYDAFRIVLNFNRSLLHQWHYYVSLRVMTCGFLVAYVYLYPTFQSVLLMLGVYFIMYYTTEWLHQFLPVRGVRIGYGSPAEFSNHMSLFEVPWINAILYAMVNGGFGLALVYLMPRTYAFINPIIHITWEVSFLGRMKTRQTARYIIFATPVVQAATAFDWGITQGMAAPKLYLHPLKFLIFIMIGRALLELHLLFLNRQDFNWARAHVITPTKNLVIVLGTAYLLELANIMPLITVYYKFIVIFGLHAFGVLVFLIPCAYCLVKALKEPQGASDALANVDGHEHQLKQEKELPAKKAD